MQIKLTLISKRAKKGIKQYFRKFWFGNKLSTLGVKLIPCTTPEKLSSLTNDPTITATLLSTITVMLLWTTTATPIYKFILMCCSFNSRLITEVTLTMSLAIEDETSASSSDCNPETKKFIKLFWCRQSADYYATQNITWIHYIILPLKLLSR